MAGEHLTEEGEFKSDKYEWCPPGFVPFKLTDEMAQPFLWGYADARRTVDQEFADDLQEALMRKGYPPDPRGAGGAQGASPSLPCVQAMAGGPAHVGNVPYLVTRVTFEDVRACWPCRRGPTRVSCLRGTQAETCSSSPACPR